MEMEKLIWQGCQIVLSARLSLMTLCANGNVGIITCWCACANDGTQDSWHLAVLAINIYLNNVFAEILKKTCTCNELRQSRAIMCHDFNSNSSPYTQKISSHTGSPRIEDLSKNQIFSDRMLWKKSFKIIHQIKFCPIKSFNLPKKTWFNPSGALTIFGLFFIKIIGNLSWVCVSRTQRVARYRKQYHIKWL